MKTDIHQYPRVFLAIDSVILGYDINQGELEVLVIQRKEEPFKDSWVLPGGFVNADEELVVAASRVLKNKAGLETEFLDLDQIEVVDRIDRDPRGRIISFVYLNLVSPSKMIVSKQASKEQLKWWPLKEINKVILGFDHNEILDKTLDNLRGRIESNPFALKMLNEEFSIPEIQKLYESIMDRKLDRGNFRKKIMSLGWLAPTGKLEDVKGHRKAELYRLSQSPKEGFS